MIANKIILVGDRAILAATNMLIVAALARLLDIETFGAFSTMLAVWLLTEVILRAAVLNPLVVLHANTTDPATFFGSWIVIALAASTLCGGAFLLALGVILKPAAYASAVATNGPLIVMSYAAFHTLRSALVLQGKRLPPLAMAVTLLVLIVIAMAAAWSGVLALDLTRACVLVAAAHIAAVGVGWIAGEMTVRVTARSIVESLHNLARSRAQIASSLILDVPGAGLFSILLGWAGGAAETARYFASRAILRPAGILLSAVDDADRAGASRAIGNGGTSAIDTWYRQARWIPLLIMGAPLAVIFLLSSELAVLVFGENYRGLGEPIRVCAVLFLLYGILMPKVIYLQTAGQSAALTRAALISLAVTLILLIVATLTGHATATGVMAAEVVGRLVLLLILNQKIARLSRAPLSAAASPLA